ncbi:hypothetical protein HK096_005007 [Nowakowskiella sp. JEL0078]|nr:hypothetical protein HK096_005007 [Nowakowskiella sp. JEL0078]
MFKIFKKKKDTANTIGNPPSAALSLMQDAPPGFSSHSPSYAGSNNNFPPNFAPPVNPISPTSTHSPNASSYPNNLPLTPLSANYSSMPANLNLQSQTPHSQQNSIDKRSSFQQDNRSSFQQDNRSSFQQQKNALNPVLIDMKNINTLIPTQQKPLRQFTWLSLSEAVQNGEMLIVGAGRYVYGAVNLDISSWIAVHPGGSVILQTALGTDVTNDFFNESQDFDKNSFLPDNSIPNRRTTSKAPNGNNNSWMNDNSSQYSASSYNTETLDEKKALIKDLKGSNILKEDWELILKARRIHRHSALAVTKIVNFLVGEIVPNQNPILRRFSGLENGEIRVFDPYEYRRYALTKKTLITEMGSTSTPVYLMRFCLVFPNSDGRIGEPEEDFKPGQGVELQATFADRTVGSRFLLPIKGNTVCFEVLVKCSGKSQMGQYLAATKTTTGTKQFKIRGPFGGGLRQRNPIGINSLRIAYPNLRDKQLRMMHGQDETQFKRLIYISSGIGILPLLQILEESVLSVGKILHAHAAYAASGPDEINLRPGDSIFVKDVYGDGWGYGFNIKTAEEGAFPASLLVPGCGLPGMGAKIVIINCVHSLGDIIGLQTIIPAVLAYPDIFQITHVVTTQVSQDAGAPAFPRGTVIEPLPGAPHDAGDILRTSLRDLEANPRNAIERFGGVVVEGRLNEELLERLVQRPYDEMESNSAAFGHPDVIVCGSNDFEQMVYEALVDELGFVDHSHVTMLPPQTFSI